MTNEELVRHAYNCGVAWALKSETALTVDQFIEANLIPVQSGGVVTMGNVDKNKSGSIRYMPIQTCPVCQGHRVVSYPPGIAIGQQWTGSSSGPWKCDQCDGKGVIFMGKIEIDPLQLPTLTPQPEARGVDLSDVIETSRMVQVDIDGRTAMYWDDWVAHIHDAFDDDLAHLQQSPQGVGDSLWSAPGKLTKLASEFLTKYGDELWPWSSSLCSAHQIPDPDCDICRRQAPQGVGEAIDDGEPCGYCARPRREHAPETYCPSSLFRELPQYTPKSILDASRLPAPVKVDDPSHCPGCGTFIMANGYGAHHSASCKYLNHNFNQVADHE